MNLVQDFFKSLKLVIALWVLTAIVYPLIMLLIGQTLFPYQANGSIVLNNQAQAVGSALIGQPFNLDRYFWSRPSAIDYATHCGASNGCIRSLCSSPFTDYPIDRFIVGIPLGQPIAPDRSQTEASNNT